MRQSHFMKLSKHLMFSIGSCLPLSGPANGNLKFDRSIVGRKYPTSTIGYYSCNEGYILQGGGGVVICLFTGSLNIAPRFPSSRLATGNRNWQNITISTNSIIHVFVKTLYYF